MLLSWAGVSYWHHYAANAADAAFIDQPLVCHCHAVQEWVEASPPRMHVPIMAHVAENIIMAEPQKKPATVDDDTAGATEGVRKGGGGVRAEPC